MEGINGSWNKTSKVVRYTLAILKSGDFCGHEELDKKIPYKCDAIWIGQTEILYINRDIFDKYLREGRSFKHNIFRC